MVIKITQIKYKITPGSIDFSFDIAQIRESIINNTYESKK
jgi:hypothetical protein